jgi:hypothetical protein
MQSVRVRLELSAQSDAGYSGQVQVFFSYNTSEGTAMTAHSDLCLGPAAGTSCEATLTVPAVPSTMSILVKWKIGMSNDDALGIKKISVTLCDIEATVLLDETPYGIPSGCSDTCRRECCAKRYWLIPETGFNTVTELMPAVVSEKRMAGPSAVALLQQDSLVVADRSRVKDDSSVRGETEASPSCVHVLGLQGTSLGKVRTLGRWEIGFLDGPTQNAVLDATDVVAAGAGNDLFIADNSNVRIRKMTLDGASQVSTLVGDGIAGGQGGIGTEARLTRVHRLAVSPDGEHLLATQAHTDGGGVMRLIRISNLNTSAASEFGPGGAEGMQDGYNGDARLSSPQGLAFFPDNGDKAVGKTHTHTYKHTHTHTFTSTHTHTHSMRHRKPRHSHS